MLSAEYANNSPIGGIWDRFPPHQNNGRYIAPCRLVAHFHRGRWRGCGSLSGQGELGLKRVAGGAFMGSAVTADVACCARPFRKTAKYAESAAEQRRTRFADRSRFSAADPEPPTAPRI